MVVNPLMIKALTFGRVRYKQLRNLIGLPIHNAKISLTPTYIGQAASDVIKGYILSDQPCMIARIGTAEFYTFLRYLSIMKLNQYPFQKSLDYIFKQSESFWWDERVRISMSIYVGFFPPTNDNLNRFCEQLLADIKYIDILGSWIADEYQIIHRLNNPIIVKLTDLEPYYHEHPWSEALAGKTVLVIHPFVESIKRQYERRTLLFSDPRVLPEFTLKTLKAVQSIAGNPCGFDSWFDALDWMCEQISQTAFDVAIIGAGAYGLPLAAHVKRLGKKAVHLGGATQILFGIRGKRWDEMPFFQKLYNEYWVRPLPSEVPPEHQRVEGGCYW